MLTLNTRVSFYEPRSHAISPVESSDGGARGPSSLAPVDSQSYVESQRLHAQTHILKSQLSESVFPCFASVRAYVGVMAHILNGT